MLRHKSTNKRRSEQAQNLFFFPSNWLIQPGQHLPQDVQRRARLFNIMLLTQIGVLLVATPFATFDRDSNRILIAVTIALSGTVLAYALARSGEIISAAWINGLSALASVSYYVLSIAVQPGVRADTVYLDFRSSMMLLGLPLIIGGIVAGTRTCLGLAALGLLIFLIIGISYVPRPGGLTSDVTYYVNLFRTPFAFIIIMSALSIIFERNIFGLFDRLARRNASLQATQEQLALKRQQALELAGELRTVLVDLKGAFDEQVKSSEQQQQAVVDVGISLEELGRVARRIDSLATQASQVAADAVGVAEQGAAVIRSNSFAYSRLQEHLEVISNSVEELNREAGQIDQVVNSVGIVAEETNMLSLNASIESAGQREHRRRFFTVATEVQRLAQRSRDAAEEVRRVVDLVQGSVKGLSNLTDSSRRGALVLSESTITSVATVSEIVTSVKKSAQLSHGILGGMHNQQGSVIGIMDKMTVVSVKSDEVRDSCRRLIQSLQELEKALVELDREDILPEEETQSEAEEAQDTFANEEIITELDSGAATSARFSWRRLWARIVMVHRRVPIAQRRNSRLLSLMTLAIGLLLAIDIPILILAGVNLSSVVAITIIGVAAFIIYGVNKAGYYSVASALFFSATFLAYVLFPQGLTTTLQMNDFLKTSAGLLGIPIMVAAILANRNWIHWMTFGAIGLTFAMAVLHQDLLQRSVLSFVPLLAFPIAFLALVGTLALFLHTSITRLTSQLEVQNRQLSVDNRELKFKYRQERNLSLQIDSLASDLHSSFEQQSEMASSQLQSIKDVTSRVEQLERGARQLVKETQQIVQVANVALELAQNGANGIEEGLQIIEEFQSQVALIAARCTELQNQAGEIGQTFELITEVAEEIDLLALNATVEASQAQSSGKRFGAVASEVQRLAGRARGASTTVHLIIARVQQAVGLCVELTVRGQSEIAQIARAAHETNYSIQEIVQIVSNTSSLMAQIQEAVHQQAVAITQVLNRLRDIAEVAQIFKDTTTSSRENVYRLSQVADSFTRMTQNDLF